MHIRHRKVEARVAGHDKSLVFIKRSTQSTQTK